MGVALFLIFFFLVFAVSIGLAILQIAGMWKVFEKVGQTGWWAIVPILNVYVLVRISGREPWWLLLYLVPCASIVVQVIVSIDVAKRFGKTDAYGVGLALLPFVFFPMLGFGPDRYLGPPLPPVL